MTGLGTTGDRGADDSLAAAVSGAFRRQVGHPPEGVWSSPGRVNLIGEHIDYNGGLVLPFALQLRTAVAAGRRPDGLLTVASVQEPGDVVSLRVDGLTPPAVATWWAYVAGVLWSFREGATPVGGIDLVVDGRVPAGSGLSSSAALECATAAAVTDLYDLDLGPVELARLAQRAERDFAGVPCGLMDQMVSVAARAGHLLLFDTATGTTEQLPFDPAGHGLRLLVVDTRVRHAHADGAFAARRRDCEDAAARLGVTSLAAITPAGLPAALAVLAEEPRLARRVRHVVSEQARARAAARLLRGGDVAGLGPLLSSSHASLRDDYAVSSPGLDVVVAAAVGAGALGARMTGGGFGGCAIALAPESDVHRLTEAVRAAAASAGQPEPTIFSAIPSAGARRDA